MENTIGVILRTNGKVEEFIYKGYESIREAVGGNIECATSGRTSKGEIWDLWGNEEGRLLELPMNQVARVFISKATGEPIDNILSLHGDFLILGCNDEGDSIICPLEIAKIAKECEMFSEPFTRFTSFSSEQENNTEHY